MRQRRRTIAWTLGSAAAVVLTVTGVLLWPILHEEWHLRRLESEDVAVSSSSADWLGQQGTLRTLERLFDVARKLVSRMSTGTVTDPALVALNRIYKVKEQIVQRLRGDAVPFLVSILKEQPPPPPSSGQMRIGAAALLQGLGTDARAAVPALKEALASKATNEDDEGFHRSVQQALGAIPEAKVARP